MHVAAVPDERAASNPNGRCLADGRREHDNANFAADVRRVSAWLAEGGVGPGDVVAVALPNCVELITTMFAAWRLGAALTPLNPALTTEEANHQITDSRAALVVVDETTSSGSWPASTFHGFTVSDGVFGNSDFRRAFTSYCRLRS
jgi:acyl-CoA synthetase (AMP-forming)/AMP-acid ligase II